MYPLAPRSSLEEEAERVHWTPDVVVAARRPQAGSPRIASLAESAAHNFLVGEVLEEGRTERTRLEGAYQTRH